MFEHDSFDVLIRMKIEGSKYICFSALYRANNEILKLVEPYYFVYFMLCGLMSLKRN